MGRGRCGLVAGLESWLPTLRQKKAKDGALWVCDWEGDTWMGQLALVERVQQAGLDVEGEPKTECQGYCDPGCPSIRKKAVSSTKLGRPILTARERRAVGRG